MWRWCDESLCWLGLLLGLGVVRVRCSLLRYRLLPSRLWKWFLGFTIVLFSVFISIIIIQSGRYRGIKNI